MRAMKQEFEQHGIMTTPGLEEQRRHIMNEARRKMEGTNGVSVLLGPTGSGKTVTARYLAKELSPGGEYEFVSAHAKMTPDDLLFRMGLTVEGMEAKDVPAKIVAAQDAYRELNRQLDENVMARDLQDIADVIKQGAASPHMVTKRVLEAVGRAAKEGKIVVIDEFNFLPPETLASLQDLLANPEAAKRGFGVIFTGNVGKDYLKRQSLDAAFVNRVVSGIVEYQFPPQELNASFENSVLERSVVKEGAHPMPRDLYMVGVDQLADRKGNVEAPEGALRDVWRLTQIFSLIQQLSSGKDFQRLGLGTSMVGTSSYQFKSLFLSFRNMNQVLREWKLEGYTKDLDWYIFQNIIRPGSVIAPKEAAQMYHLFMHRGGFFSGDSWKAIHVDVASWDIQGVDSIEDMKGTPASLKQFETDEVVEAVSGMGVPSYEELGITQEDLEKNLTKEKEAEIDREEGKKEEEKRLYGKELPKLLWDFFELSCPLSEEA